MLTFVVNQTDVRMKYLKNQLNELKTFLPIEKNIYVFAPNILITPSHLDDFMEDCILIAGNADEESSVLFNCINTTHFNMLEDEEFQAINSKLTAEGTLYHMIEKHPKSIFECKVLVIGFGRTGASVVNALSKLGIDLTIASNSSVRSAHAFVNRVIPSTNFDFSTFDIVINTVPLPIISNNEVLTMKKHSLYIDLASKPALDLKFAKAQGIFADIYPALPAKVSPRSASNAIKEYVIRVLKSL